jgi:hypothetical protein
MPFRGQNKLTAAQGNLNGKIMGKMGKSYKVEELHRLLQEFGVIWCKSDRKEDLIRKLARYVETRGPFTTKDRVKILSCPLDVQPIRYQVLDENGSFKHHAYPPQLYELLDNAAEKAVAKEHRRMIDGNARGCSGCLQYVAELDFPRRMGRCCKKVPSFCRACIEKDLSTKIKTASAQECVTCPMCHAAMEEEDVQVITTAKTFDE